MAKQSKYKKWFDKFRNVVRHDPAMTLGRFCSENNIGESSLSYYLTKHTGMSLTEFYAKYRSAEPADEDTDLHETDGQDKTIRLIPDSEGKLDGIVISTANGLKIEISTCSVPDAASLINYLIDMKSNNRAII